MALKALIIVWWLAGAAGIDPKFEATPLSRAYRPSLHFTEASRAGEHPAAFSASGEAAGQCPVMFAGLEDEETEDDSPSAVASPACHRKTGRVCTPCFTRPAAGRWPHPSTGPIPLRC